jgi:transcriptional regulator with GAF, ATPase, and Fis domain
VTGETGAGKEIVATALHAWAPRSRSRLVAVNCAAVPENLLESELFGHTKGAFSGADAMKPGLFEVASGGTVFLDEIGECSPSARRKS